MRADAPPFDDLTHVSTSASSAGRVANSTPAMRASRAVKPGRGCIHHSLARRNHEALAQFRVDLPLDPGIPCDACGRRLIRRPVSGMAHRPVIARHHGARVRQRAFQPGRARARPDAIAAPGPRAHVPDPLGHGPTLGELALSNPALLARPLGADPFPHIPAFAGAGLAQQFGGLVACRLSNAVGLVAVRAARFPRRDCGTVLRHAPPALPAIPGCACAGRTSFEPRVFLSGLLLFALVLPIISCHSHSFPDCAGESSGRSEPATSPTTSTGGSSFLRASSRRAGSSNRARAPAGPAGCGLRSGAPDRAGAPTGHRSAPAAAHPPEPDRRTAHGSRLVSGSSRGTITRAPASRQPAAVHSSPM